MAVVRASRDPHLDVAQVAAAVGIKPRTADRLATRARSDETFTGESRKRGRKAGSTKFDPRLRQSVQKLAKEYICCSSRHVLQMAVRELNVGKPMLSTGCRCCSLFVRGMTANVLGGACSSAAAAIAASIGQSASGTSSAGTLASRLVPVVTSMCSCACSVC